MDRELDLRAENAELRRQLAEREARAQAPGTDQVEWRDPHLATRWLRISACLCGAAVAGLGATGLAGWLTHDYLLAAFGQAYYSMAPASGLSFLLAGTALGTLLFPRRFSPWVTRGGALLIAAIAVLRLGEVGTGVDLNVSKLFVLHGTMAGGIMAVPTALGFLDASLVLLLLTGRGRRALLFCTTLALVLLGLAFAFGYVYGRPLLYGAGAVPMALPAALAFVALGMGPILVVAARDLDARRRVEEERDHLNAEVKAQRNLLDTVVTNAPVGLVLLDGHDLRVKVANPVESLFLDEPYRSMDLAGLPLHEFVPDAEESGVAGIYREVAATGQARSFAEFEFLGFARGVTYWRWVIVPVDRPDGEGYDVLFMVAEVTEQVLARRRVEESAEVAQRQAALLSLAPVLARDPDDRIVYWGEGMEALYGYTADQARGQVTHDLLQTIHPEPIASIREQIMSAGVWQGELVHRARDGHSVTVVSRQIAYQDAEGVLLQILEVNTDITLLRQAQEQAERLTGEARRQAAELLALIDSIADAVVVWGPQGEVLRANQHALEFLGTDNDVWTLPWEENWARLRQRTPEGEPIPMDQGPRTRAMRGEVVRGMHMLVARSDGTDAIVSASAATFREAEGNVGGVVATFSDIGPLVKAEQEAQRRALEAEALNQELESFAYSVSHDLRAPLRALDGFSEALLEDYGGKLDATGETYLQRIRAGSQRMGQLIDDLLKLSRVSRDPLRPVAVELSQMAEEIVAALRSTEPERSVEVRIQPGVTARGDRQLLNIVLVNLLSNAWKFTAGAERARIEFGTTEQDGETVHYVRDNGAGFDMTYSDKLFAPFQRLHSLQEFPGNGVGWRRSCASLIAMGAGRGRRGRSGRAPPSILRCRNERKQAMDSKIILLVEDNPDDVLLIERALKGNNVLNRVVVARDGVEALDYFFGPGAEQRAVPQVVLLDLKLPKVSGLEVLQRMRDEQRTRLLPVVVLTTSDEQVDMVRSYELGASSYVRKPVDFNEFLQAVRTLGVYWLLLNEVPSVGE
jgi:PAS domain S-box-containing protein